MPTKKRENENFEKQKNCVSFSCPKDHSTQKSGSQAKKRALQPAYRQTDRHESDYCGNPFRVSGVFPSTYHQGSARFPQFLLCMLFLCQLLNKTKRQRFTKVINCFITLNICVSWNNDSQLSQIVSEYSCLLNLHFQGVQ